MRADGTDSGPASASSISVIDVAPPTLTDVQTLDSSFRWSGNAVHYAFPDTADGFTGGQGQYSSYNEIGAMLNLSEFGKDSLREGFAQWDAVTALTIEEAAPGTMAEINVGASSIPSTAWAYYPGTQPANGDIWFNTNQWYLDALASAPEPIIGSYAYATGMHEFGHALGLKHPHQIVASGTTALAATYDAVEFSIMSYRSFPGGNIGGYTLETWGYPQSPMMLDIAMIQQMYGADYGTLAGDTTYTVSTQTGEVFVDGVSLGAPGANRVFRTLWDGNGTDHIDLSNYTTSMYADLNAGRGIKFDTIGTFQTAKLASGVYAGFNIYMSLLHGDDTRSLIENLTTGSGDDTLIGNAAVNVLSGGSGNDTFRSGLGADIVELGSGADVLIGTLAELDGDTVTDFSIAEDRIVLEDLTLGAGHFTLMSDGVLLIDDDGDGNADARITLGAGVAGAEIMVTAQDSSTLVTLQQPSVDPDPEPDPEPDPDPVGTELVRIDFDGGVAQDSASATQLSYSQDGLGVAGETAEGFRLTGSTKIVLDRFAPHLQNLDAFTIEMSLKRDAGSAGNFLDSHTTLDAVVGADGALSFRIATTDGVFALATDPGLVTSGVWHKIAMSYDASQSLLQLYVDDVLGAETAATGTLTGLGTYPLVIGNTWSSSLKGDIDNFVILDAAQTFEAPSSFPPADPDPVGTELVRIDFDGGVAQDSASATQLSYSQDGLGVAGETAEGFRLTGSTKIVLDRFAPHLQSLDAFTIEMSLKRDADSAGNFLDSHTTLDAVVGADGALSFRIATTDGVFALATDPGLVTSGVWHKIAMSYDASQSLLQLYVDDVLGAETAATGTLTGLGTYPLVIGNTWSSSLKGDIDNFVILDAAQTSGQQADTAAASSAPLALGPDSFEFALEPADPWADSGAAADLVDIADATTHNAQPDAHEDTGMDIPGDLPFADMAAQDSDFLLI